MLRNSVGGRGISFPGKKRYEGVSFVVITREWVGVQFPGKRRYVTLAGMSRIRELSRIRLPNVSFL